MGSSEIDVLFDFKTGESSVVDKTGTPVERVQTSFIEPFDADKAQQITNLIISGLPLPSILKQVNLTRTSYASWQKDSPEFSDAVKLAKETRADFLIERTYEEDVLASYQDLSNVKELKQRQAIAHEHIKVASPQRFDKAAFKISDSRIHLTINSPEPKEADKAIKSSIPKVEEDGNISAEFSRV